MNKALFLTRGNPIGIASLLSRLNPSSSIYTAVLEPPDGGRHYYSQVLHQAGSRSARFCFLTPDFSSENDDLSALIDFLCFQAGEMGALNILAEIEESHPLFDLLRQAGFSIFSWESIWKFPANSNSKIDKSGWMIPSPVDENTIRSLFQTLVPPLVQNAEPFTNGGALRLVYKTNDEVLAYVESLNGPEGFYLIPVIHPSVEDIGLLLQDLNEQFSGLGKPVYLQVRSYQAWLSDALQQLKAEPSPRFALLVKHLVLTQLSKASALQRSLADQPQTEPSASLLHNINNKTPSAKVSK